MKKTYEIALYGCDDTTRFKMLLTDEEYELLKRVADEAENASQYSCMPTMEIKPKEDTPK